MIDLEAPEVFFHYTPSQCTPRNTLGRVRLIRYSSSIDPSYPVYGGLFEKEAIMLLRRFYIQENEKGKELGRTNLNLDYLLITCQLLTLDRRRIES
jgi:hypothetical protein